LPVFPCRQDRRAICREEYDEFSRRLSVLPPAWAAGEVRSRAHFVMHCHMMNHEELGMMQVVEVYKA